MNGISFVITILQDELSTVYTPAFIFSSSKFIFSSDWLTEKNCTAVHCCCSSKLLQHFYLIKSFLKIYKFSRKIISSPPSLKNIFFPEAYHTRAERNLFIRCFIHWNGKINQFLGKNMKKKTFFFNPIFHSFEKYTPVNI